MAVFIELTTSPLESNFEKVRKKFQPNTNEPARAGRKRARRPLRGLEVKEDTYASLRVIKADSKPLPLIDSGLPDGYNSKGYTNFLLQQVNEARMEKHQIIETFGASYVFFFGEQPRFLDVQAVLLNSHDFNWEAEWWANYNTYLRGTKLVEMGARCYLSYDDSIVEGYMVMAQATKLADQHFIAKLQFKFFVTNCTNVSNVGNPMFPIRASVQLPSSIQLTAKDAGAQIISALQGEVYGAAEVRNFDTRGKIGKETQRLAVPGSYRTLSQLLREVPPSVGVSADWWPALEGRGPGNQAGLKRLVTRAGMSIRSLIATNQDEIVGAEDTRTQFGFKPGEQPRPPSMQSRQTRTLLEALDLHQQATEFLSCYGANINSPTAYSSLGLQANFSASATASAGASYNAQSNASWGYTAGSGVGLGAVAGGSYNTSASAVAETRSGFAAYAGASASAGYNDSFQSDTLGVVYGRRSSRDVRFSSERQKIVETGFDYTYGYESDYARRPGFGRAGFGDYGGVGFGSANAFGDPGFRDPNRFTFAGVADESSAFERFLRARQDRTALTPGQVAGRGALTGGASVSVDGRVSAFALASVEGSLDPFGTARDNPANISARRANQGLGFSIGNPLGFGCAAPGGGLALAGAGASAGAYASANAGFSPGSGFSAGAQASAGTFYSPGAGAGASATASASASAFAGASASASAGAFAGIG
jgi:hypothetical protein